MGTFNRPRWGTFTPAGLGYFLSGDYRGGVSREMASRLQTRSVIIEPGKQIVQEAISQARALAAARRREMEYHERMQTILEIMDDGMICVDGFGNLNFYNQTAESILEKDLEPYLGRSVSEFADVLGLIDVLTTKSGKIAEIIKIQDNELVVNSLPIVINDRVRGAVSLLKEGSAIHGIERKLRERIYRKGFIAKHKMKDIAAESPGMRKLIAKAKQFAKTEAAILVTGETGTGKELLIHAIHNLSLRKKAPFVVVNCAALSETLLESELFGHEEGAFTGAKRGGKIGLFELADHGTIFLDEIGDISANLQVRLLRVLENKEVMRVGGDKIVPVDVRIISSTHKDLRQEAQAGRFRKDLYFRLAVLRLSIPPLRQRMQDIPKLLTPILKRYHKPLSCVTPAMTRQIELYDWPGNIRELNSLIESYLILLGSRKHDEHLFHDLFAEYGDFIVSDNDQAPAEKVAPAFNKNTNPDGEGASHSLKEQLEKQKKRIIRQTLHQYGNNKALTAKRLGISTNTLWRALRKTK